MSGEMRDFVELVGDRKLIRKLMQFEKESTQRKVVRPALMRALVPISKAAKQKCPTESKAMRKAIVRKVKTRKGELVGLVGVASDEKYTVIWKGKKRVPNKYAHAVEFGHGAGKKGLGTIAPAHPFLRPARDEQTPAALAILRQCVAENIEKEARRK